MKEGYFMAKRLQQCVKVGKDANGRSIYKTVHGLTQQELYEKAAAEMVKAGNFSVPKQTESAPLLSDYILTWFETFKVPKLKKNTAVNYRIDICKHIIPYFEGKRLDEITTADVQGFYNSKAHLAHSTVHCMAVILHGTFQSAIEDGYLVRNPTESKRLSMTDKKTERNALPAETIGDIIRNLWRLEDFDRLLLALLLFTGMRRGEALGLRWEDIDWRHRLIFIQRSVSFSGNSPVIGTTKSKAGVRYIPLANPLAQTLMPFETEEGFILGGERPITQCKFLRAWERINKTICLYGATPHILRHSFITARGSLCGRQNPSKHCRTCGHQHHPEPLCPPADGQNHGGGGSPSGDVWRGDYTRTIPPSKRAIPCQSRG